MSPKLTAKSRRRAQLWGGAFIIVGVPGIVLPIIQGVLLILVGLVLFSLCHDSLRKRLAALCAWSPLFAKLHAKAEQFAKRIFRLEEEDAQEETPSLTSTKSLSTVRQIVTND